MARRTFGEVGGEDRRKAGELWCPILREPKIKTIHKKINQRKHKLNHPNLNAGKLEIVRSPLRRPKMLDPRRALLEVAGLFMILWIEQQFFVTRGGESKIKTIHRYESDFSDVGTPRGGLRTFRATFG